MKYSNKDIKFAGLVLASYDILFNKGRVTLEAIRILTHCPKDEVIKNE